LVEALGATAAQMREPERLLEKGLLQLARQHPQWSAIMPVVARWPGVGEGLAAALLGIVGDLSRFPTPRRLQRYMGMGVGPDGRALRRRRGVTAPWRGDGRAWCHLVMEQWLHWGRRPPGWDELLAYEMQKGEKGAKIRTARKLVQRLLTEFWVAANGSDPQAHDKEVAHVDSIDKQPAV
jgi:transposase